MEILGDDTLSLAVYFPKSQSPQVPSEHSEVTPIQSVSQIPEGQNLVAVTYFNIKTYKNVWSKTVSIVMYGNFLSSETSREDTFLRTTRNLDFLMGEVYALAATVKKKLPNCRLVLSGVLRRSDTS